MNKLNMINLDGKKVNLHIGKLIGSGSNSLVYECTLYRNQELFDCVIKLPHNTDNYISCNLQRYSYQICEQIQDEQINIPKVMAYGINNQLGEFLVLEKMDSTFRINQILKHKITYNDQIILLLGRAIARLHKIGISGYDTEFYWDLINFRLILLDIGPVYTFNKTAKEMLQKHIGIEKNNKMGKWNIISQIISESKALDCIDKNDLEKIKLEDIENSLLEDTMQRHIVNTAKTNALLLFGELSLMDKNEYFHLFRKAYKHEIGSEFSINNLLYLNKFEEALFDNLNMARAQLYYSKYKTISNMSCTVVIE